MRLPHCLLLPFATAGLLAQTASWSNFLSAPQPNAVAWDAVRHTMVIVGPATQQHLWEWDGAQLHERLPVLQNLPNVRQMMFDERRQRIVAIGESATQSGYWVGSLDAAGWTWWTGGAVPAADASAVAVCDSWRDRVVLYRGSTSGSTLHEWNGQQWHLVDSGTGPVARTGAAFAYDPIGRRCVLYGGKTGTTVLADCWSWDGFAWTQLTTAGAPGPRQEAAFGFDPFGNRLVLYGGLGADTATWQLVGTQWTQVATTAAPGVQRRARLFADDQGLLLVGPSCDQVVFDYDPAGTLWRLQGNQWAVVGHLPNPTPINNVQAAYDRIRGQIVAFSGTPTSAFPHPDLTILFDRQWRYTSPAHVPARRHTGRLCWSEANLGVLLFGGCDTSGMALDDTWIWDGGDWQRQALVQSPAARWGHVLTEDPLGGLMLFGGTNGQSFYDDQWHWDGLAWQPVQTTQRPVARAYATAGFDPGRLQVVLFGGYTSTTSYPETWTWDGITWTWWTTSSIPSKVKSMAFHPATGRLALLGSGGYEWTGSDWYLSAVLAPSNSWHALVTDTNHGLLLDVQPPVVSVFTASRAQSQRYGQGCSLGRTPALDAIDEPALGAPFALEVGGAAGAMPAFLIVGLGAQSQPLGGGSASLVATQLAVYFALTDPSARARFPLQLPSDPGLRGVQFTAQGAIWAPQQSQLGTVSLTPGLSLTFGD